MYVPPSLQEFGIMHCTVVHSSLDLPIPLPNSLLLAQWLAKIKDIHMYAMIVLLAPP